MTRDATIQIIERIITEYKPYIPQRRPVRVLAHYIPNAIDTDEALNPDGGIKQLYFELITERQILDESSPDNLGIDFSYSFVAEVSPDDPAYENVSGKFAEESYCWVTLIGERDETNQENSISGYATISYSVPLHLRIEEELPTITSAYLSWQDGTRIEENDLKEKHLDYVRDLDNRFREETSRIDNNQKSGSSDSEKGIRSDSGNSGSVDSGKAHGGNDGSSKDGNSSNGSGSSNPAVVDIQIYRVGLANTIYLKYSNDKSILLDCGLDVNNPKTKKYTNTRNYILKHLKPTTLIITHWHTDHYNLLTDFGNQMKLGALEQIIYPEYGPIPKAIKSIFLKLKNKGVRLIPFSKTTKTYNLGNDYPFTTIWRGNGSIPSSTEQQLLCIGKNSNDPKNVKINDNGLILLVDCNGREVILPADVGYYCWPDEIKNKLSTFEIMVLPHHGCQVYGLSNVPVNQSNCKQVYISNRFNIFADLKDNYHRTFIDTLLNDTTNNKHSYTEDLTQQTIYKHFYLIKI